MIKCFKLDNIPYIGNIWKLDAKFNSNDMKKDISLSCAWILGREISKIYLDIDDVIFQTKEWDVSKIQKELELLFLTKKNYLKDEDFLI
jgi:hypothetical protein